MKKEESIQNNGSGTLARSLGKVFPIRKSLLPFFPKPSPKLEVDDEITLMALQPQDEEKLYELIEWNRGHLEEWLPWIHSITSLEDCQEFMKSIEYSDIFSGKWVYAIWYKEQLVGLMDFNEGDKELNQIAIGYWLGEYYQGKGIVTRAVTASLDYVFDVQQIHKVLLKFVKHNEKSQAVALRLNFQWEGIQQEAGTLNGETVDMITYSMLYRDWWNQRKEKEAEKE